MKKLPIIPVLAGIAVLIIIGGVVFAKKMNNKSAIVTPTPTPEPDAIENIPAESLDINLEPRYDKKAVILTANGLFEKGFVQFEYEVSYDTESGLTQGSFSKEPVKVTKEEFKREILLGTCSKNVCKYDRGVKSVNVTVRLLDKDNKTKIWQKEFNIE